RTWHKPVVRPASRTLRATSSVTSYVPRPLVETVISDPNTASRLLAACGAVGWVGEADAPPGEILLRCRADHLRGGRVRAGGTARLAAPLRHERHPEGVKEMQGLDLAEPRDRDDVEAVVLFRSDPDVLAAVQLLDQRRDHVGVRHDQHDVALVVAQHPLHESL